MIDKNNIMSLYSIFDLHDFDRNCVVPVKLHGLGIRAYWWSVIRAKNR